MKPEQFKALQAELAELRDDCEILSESKNPKAASRLEVKQAELAEIEATLATHEDAAKVAKRFK